MSTCSFVDYPFVFYDENKEIINGTLFGDSCIFPDANCLPGVPAKDCCDVNISISENVEVGNDYIQIAWAFAFSPMIWALIELRKSLTPEEREEYDKEQRERRPQFITGSNLPKWLECFLLMLWELGFSVMVTAKIVVGIYLKISEQRFMTVTERTALAAAEAFMVPFKTIFTFVEDIIMIRVSFAMFQGDKQQTDRLIHIGLAGVIFTGFLAGVIGTILGIFESSLRVITNPGGSNDVALYPGCSFIESVNTDTIFPYWIFESWESMAIQITGVLSGFMNGAFEYATFGWMASISQFVFIGIWFPNIENSTAPVTLLGIAEFAADWSLPLILIAFLKSPLSAQLRDRTGLDLSFKKVLNYLLQPFCNRTTERQENTAERKKESVVLLKQGLQLLFIEASVQAWTSCSTYLALRADSATGYQLTAFQSDLPLYGTSMSTGMSYCIKFVGPLLLANARPKLFVDFIKWNVVATILLVILVIGSTVPFLRNMALNSGKNSCAYASSTECLSFFDKVMGENGEGGTYTLPFTYYLFAIASSLEVILMIVRATLLTVLDFDYMVLATIIANISYIPAIGVAKFARVDFQMTAIAYLASFYIPILVLIVCMGIRVVIILRKILNDEPGAWTPKQEKRRTMLATIRDKKLAKETVSAAVAAVNSETDANEVSEA